MSGTVTHSPAQATRRGSNFLQYHQQQQRTASPLSYTAPGLDTLMLLDPEPSALPNPQTPVLVQTRPVVALPSAFDASADPGPFHRPSSAGSRPLNDSYGSVPPIQARKSVLSLVHRVSVSHEALPEAWAPPKPFLRHFGCREFGVPDESVRRLNEQIEADAVEWKRQQNRVAEVERKEEIVKRRQYMRHQFQSRMKENYERSLLRKEPHAVHRLRQFLSDTLADTPDTPSPLPEDRAELAASIATVLHTLKDDWRDVPTAGAGVSQHSPSSPRSSALPLTSVSPSAVSTLSRRDRKTSAASHKKPGSPTKSPERRTCMGIPVVVSQTEGPPAWNYAAVKQGIVPIDKLDTPPRETDAARDRRRRLVHKPDLAASVAEALAHTLHVSEASPEADTLDTSFRSAGGTSPRTNNKGRKRAAMQESLRASREEHDRTLTELAAFESRLAKLSASQQQEGGEKDGAST
eukprot:TRINITY_DN56379_c0_g1_i1.p1 TRINITY_DN56379_c0_g1~~TRINITY_DN56379_c0_g1_i1.p1  ORF type:complete len:464 (-),score=47.73 TRINITY_DN56379_c0_g1_i1:125-1516(-)